MPLGWGTLFHTHSSVIRSRICSHYLFLFKYIHRSPLMLYQYEFSLSLNSAFGYAYHTLTEAHQLYCAAIPMFCDFYLILGIDLKITNLRFVGSVLTCVTWLCKGHAENVAASRAGTRWKLHYSTLKWKGDFWRQWSSARKAPTD